MQETYLGVIGRLLSVLSMNALTNLAGDVGGETVPFLTELVMRVKLEGHTLILP